jgi:2'-5' RNA ligase
VHLVVELFLDEASEAAVRAIWRALAEAEIAGVPAGGARPHLSVTIYEALAVGRFKPALEAFAAERAALDVTLGFWGAFPGAEGVVFLAPVMTRELLALQAEFHERLGEFGPAPARYRPGSWVPHCTLAAGFPADHVGAAAEVCHRVVRPISARVERIGLVEYRPRRERCAFAFGARAVSRV